MRDESDDELRWRVRYVTGNDSVVHLSGVKLDAYAEQFNLKRRKVQHTNAS